jgi:hypothetical protein
MSESASSHGWERILNRTKISHVGTHGIRHRATTEIANSGVPVKVGMQLTAHKRSLSSCDTSTREDAPVRAAAEVVAMRRRTMLEAACSADATATDRAAAAIVAAATPSATLVNDAPYTPRGRFGIAEVQTARFHRGQSEPSTPAPRRNPHRAVISLSARSSGSGVMPTWGVNS